MNTATIIADLQEMFPRLMPLQREAIISSFSGVNPTLPGNAEVWAALQALIGMGQGDPAQAATDVSQLRAALEILSLADWRTYNNTLFLLRRGNIFDEAYEIVEGGGIRYTFAQRYLDFLSFVEEERTRLGLQKPTVLDVGCWQGTLTLELAQRGFLALGTDIGEAIEDVIEERASHLTPVAQACFAGFVPGWAHEVVPTLGRFDIVTCQETLEHIPTAVLGRTCQALLGATRHTLLITVPGWDDSWPGHLRVYTEEQLATMFCADGFDVEIVRPAGGMCYTTLRVRRCQ